MNREEVIARIRARSDALNECDSPEQEQDTNLYYDAREQLEQTHPDIVNDPEQWQKLCDLDAEAREAGDERGYLARWEAIIQQMRGTAPDFQRLTHLLLNGTEQEGAAVIAWLQRKPQPVQQQNEEVDEDADRQQAIFAARAFCGPYQVEQAKIGLMRRKLA